MRGEDQDVEAGSYEHEVEYDRLHTAVSLPQVEEYVRRLHASHSHHDNTPKLRHCYAVSELAGRHARVLLADADFFAKRYRELVCRAGGLLHEAADHGAFFEDLVAAADEATAQLVAAVTADRRLPRPKRVKVYCNQLGLAPAFAQAVKLADLQHDCLLLKGSALPSAVEWAEEAQDVLAALGRIHAVSGLDAQVRRLKDDLREMTCRPRRKR